MFSRNVAALLGEMLNEGALNIDLDDEVIAGTMLTHEGKIMNQHVIDLLDFEEEEKS
jgi:NAD(P) transhydrogenase subunit alpha